MYLMLGKVYITGDMNGQTSNFADNLEFDKYIENDGLIFDMSHVPDRINKDDGFDTHGRKLLDVWKSTGFIIANGCLGGDCNVGEYTYCSTQGMSTVDYHLLHNADFNYHI